MTKRVFTASRGYVLALATLTYTSGWVDRGIFSILGQAVKTEFALTDWQLGLLSGTAFTLCYTLFGLPLGRLADRVNRVTLISVSILAWSVMTMLCGLAGSLLVLILLRCGVGIGEAGGNPACHSLLADLYRRDERTLALSVYGLGVPLGITIGAVAGGYLTDAYGWRVALFAVGAPGALLAMLFQFTVREPARGAQDDEPTPVTPPSFGQALRVILAEPAIRHIMAGLSILIVSGGVVQTFIGPYFLRMFDLSYATVGAILGIGNGVASACGALLIGYLSQRLGRRSAGLTLAVPAIGIALSGAFQMVAYLQADWHLTVLFLTIGVGAGGAYLAPAFAAIHTIVRADMRGTAVAAAFMAMNLVGFAVAPVVAGLGIDLIAGHIFSGLSEGSFATRCLATGTAAAAGQVPACATALRQATRIVLLLSTPLPVWAACHYVRAGTLYRRLLAARAAPAAAGHGKGEAPGASSDTVLD